MPAWLAPAIGLAGSALSTAGSLYAANQAQGNQQGQLQMAVQNYMLQKKIAEEQQRMARAGRTDAAGNRVYFNGQDWVSDPTDATRGIISASQANERQNQVSGGFRREAGQSANFAARGAAGNEADAVLRLLRDRVGAPDFDGFRGRNAVAAATEVGENRDSLVDAVARNMVRSGGNVETAGRAVDNINTSSAGKLRTALAKNDAAAPEQFRVANEGYETGRLNKFAPLQGVRSNLTDGGFSPTQIGAPIDASLNQAATYGSATSGRGAAGLNAGASLVNNVPYTPMPWGNAIGGLTDVVAAYLKNRKSAGDSPIPWNEDSRNPSAYNNWSF